MKDRPKQWTAGVGKRCAEGKGKHTCKTSPNCNHPWWIKVQWKGDRKSGYGPVTNFLFLWKDHPQAPQTRREAQTLAGRVLTWLQQGKPMADAPPAKAQAPAVVTASLTGQDLIERWLKARATNHVRKLTNKGSIGAFDSKVSIVCEFFGKRPIEELEAGECISEFIDLYIETDRQASTAHGLLAAVLRPAMLWGAGKQDPIITYVPFGKHRIQLSGYDKGNRDTRITPHQEAHLLDAAGVLDDKDYQFAGRTLHDFSVCMIDLGPRPEDLFTACNSDVDWHAHRLTFRNTKYQGESRIVPFNPDGRVAEVLQRRRFAGPSAPILCDYLGEPVTTVYRVWVHGVCIANNITFVQTKSGGRPTPETMDAYKACNLVPYSARHEFATWCGLCGVSDETARFVKGHARQKDAHTGYKHEQLLRATNELREKLWPREGERAQFDRLLQKKVG